MMGGAFPSIIHFPLERPVFIREYSSGTYGVLAYFIPKLCVEIPFEFLRCLIIIIITYWTE